MKKLVVAVAFCATFFGLGFAQNLCGYKTPETFVQDLDVSFYYRHYDDPATAELDISSGRLLVDYNLLKDSPSLGYAFGGAGELSLVGLGFGGIAGQASGTVRRYFAEGLPYFAFGGLESSWASGFPQPGVEVRAGLGYGHFTDVTPMAKAYRIEAKLLSLGAITASLSDATILSIAEEIGRMAEFADLTDLISEIEAKIEEETGATLDAKALLAIEDIIKETGKERYCGYAVQIGLGYELLDPQGGARDFLLTLSADGALAPEPGSQFLVRASLSGPYQIMEQHTLTLSASYDYQLTDTTSFTAEYSLRQVKPKGQVPAGDQSASFQLAFNLGKTDLSLQVTFSKVAEAPGWTQDFLISVGMDLL
ncbi:hypothetical protein J7J35_03640 [Candidatus Bipolaricaulota bacterium]|nr:hypothetical protein [Candidatus Bipolaricaulota bacterium]